MLFLHLYYNTIGLDSLSGGCNCLLFFVMCICSVLCNYLGVFRTLVPAMKKVYYVKKKKKKKKQLYQTKNKKNKNRNKQSIVAIIFCR
jgi:uncharacterized ion transporter superfamily protein YfcC